MDKDGVNLRSIKREDSKGVRTKQSISGLSSQKSISVSNSAAQEFIPPHKNHLSQIVKCTPACTSSGGRARPGSFGPVIPAYIASTYRIPQYWQAKCTGTIRMDCCRGRLLSAWIPWRISKRTDVVIQGFYSDPKGQIAQFYMNNPSGMLDIEPMHYSWDITVSFWAKSNLNQALK